MVNEKLSTLGDTYEEDLVDQTVANNLFPFTPDVASAAGRLTYAQLRNALSNAFGDIPDYEAREAVLFAGIKEGAREK